MVYKNPCYKNSLSCIEHPVLITEIKREERIKEYLVLVESKKGAGRKKEFISLNQNKIEERRICSVR